VNRWNKDRLRREQFAKEAVNQWTDRNGPEARNLLAAAVLETIRQNESLRALATDDCPVTPVTVARAVHDFEQLNWQPMKAAVDLFGPFLARQKSKKQINRFTLQFTDLLQHYQPELSQQLLIVASANNFLNLLKRRRVSERAWRNILLSLIERGFLLPSTQMLLWCKRFPDEGFITSPSFARLTLHPLCPACGLEAHALASFRPDGWFDGVIALKDGVLGAALGWYFLRNRIPFRHAEIVRGEELDFVVEGSKHRILIECKVLKTSAADKQLRRRLRDALEQLRRHAVLLEREGRAVSESVCVVNLTGAELKRVSILGSLGDGEAIRLLSYEGITKWLGQRLTAQRLGNRR
jgi:hypothetical protein